MFGKLCRECGLSNPPWKLTNDGWCDRCAGEKPAREWTVPPIPDPGPAVWMVTTSWPGVSAGPWTLSQATEIAGLWGGRVRPWVEPKVKTQATGVYPHPGQRPGSRPAKYGAALQNSRGASDD